MKINALIELDERMDFFSSLEGNITRPSRFRFMPRFSHTKEVGPTGRFGPRYGATLRRKVRDIEVEQRKKHICPRCGARAVKRVAVGIRVCKKCGFKFAGGARTPVTEVGKTARYIIASLGGSHGTTP